MQLYRFFLFSISLLLSTAVFAQEEETPPINHGYATAGIGYGITAFKGDLGSGENSEWFNNFRSGFNLSVEKRIGKNLGFALVGTFGKFSQNERGIARNLSFETKFTQIGINAQAHLDTKTSTTFSPFFGLGVSYLIFNPSGDLKDKDGIDYQYWSDGTIRDLPEFDENGKRIDKNKKESKVIVRDYKYETNLVTSSDSTATSYPRNAITFPITFGLKFRLSEFIETRLSAIYNLSMSDYLDSYKGDGNNDSYIYAHMSLNYTIAKKYVSPEEKHFNSVDFTALMKEDSDGDGVPDVDDKCANSPGGVLVNKLGCPLDDDDDGVPNYLDKEERTPPRSVVNRFGVALTDSDLEIMRLMRDSVYAERITKFSESPTLESLKEIDNQISNKSMQSTSITGSIPSKLRFSDLNGDGILKSDEITKVIDGFFEGEYDITVATIMEVIDYFFEQ